MNKITTFFLLLLALPLWGQGGVFPVQVLPQALPPAPIYFSDYAAAGTLNGPLQVQLVLNDLNITNREIRLKAYFEGNGIAFQSNDVVIGAHSLFLEGGIPLTLTHAELAPYFRFENITGISPEVYGKTIPEGAYQFCFEVIDVLTGNRLSQKSCATAMVFQNEPPFLVSPMDKSNLEERNPQNIVFQWTPRHINVGNVEYELSIVEIWDDQVDPQQAFLSSPPIFQTTTTATTYVYGPADPLFLPNKKYAWRIRAMAKKGTEEIGLFKNQGYSEIHSFSYATACGLPQSITHKVKGSTNANISWDDFTTDVPEYTVRYRKSISASTPLSDQEAWFLSKTTANGLTLWDLKAATTYEYQVNKKCVLRESDWSPVKEFTTPIDNKASDLYECGIPPNIDLTNKEPLPKLQKNDVFTAGDFPVTVLKVSGSNGRFTGKGYVNIPYLGNVRVGVEFTNILVNNEKQLAEGTVITTYDPSLKNVLDADEVVEMVDTVSDVVTEPFEGDNDLDEININFPIPKESVGDYIKVKDGQVIITNPANGATVSEPLGDDMVVTDSTGQTYKVDEDGKISVGGLIDEGGTVNSTNVEGVSNNGQLEQLTAKNIQITFKEVPEAYGFDAIPSLANSTVTKEYATIKDADGNDYTLVNQAVEKGQVSHIDALITQTGDNPYPVDSIVFKTKQGEKIPVEIIDDHTIRLTLTGSYSFENETIYAVVPSREDKTKQLTAGAFTLWHLTDRTVNVVLVPVNGANIPNDVATHVKDVFKKGVTTLNIDIDDSGVQLDPSLLGSDEKLDIGDSAWLTNYNEEQKQVIASLKPQINYNKNTYYLFVFGDNVRPAKSIGGFMPLQRQFGFVFEAHADAHEERKGELFKTIAHEIGHGVFALRHPFVQYGKDLEGNTDWLMDYAEGSLLSHMDWAQMHNPDLKFYVFQDDEEGEIAGKTWLDPSWKPFKVDSDISRTIIAFDLGDNFKGAIPGFKTNDGHQFRAKFTKGSFDGYFDADQNKYSPEYPNLKNGDKVFLFEYRGCGDNRRYDFKYNSKNKSLVDYRAEQPNAPVKRYEDACNTTTTSNPFNASICSYFEQTDDLQESTIEAAVEKLNLAYQTRKSLSKEHIRNKENFYHLVNVGKADFDGRAGILEDKLFLLKQTTGINFYVIFQPIAARLSPKARDDLANEVLKRSDLPDFEDNVVITLPYMTTYDGVVSVINCVQPGFAQSAAGILPSDRRDFRQTDNLFEYVLGAFAGLEKPLFLRRYFIKANGSLVNYHIQRLPSQKIRGMGFINAIEFYESPNLEAIASLQIALANTSEQNSVYSDAFKELRKDWVKRLNQLFKESEKEEIEAFSTNNLGYWKPRKFDGLGSFREFYVRDAELCNTFVTSNINSPYLEGWRIFFGKSKLEAKYLNNYDEWNVIDNTIYTGLDAISLFPGADTATDIAGFLYAGLRGDILNTTIYGTSAAVPLVSAAYLRGVKNGVEYTDEAFAIAAKKVDGQVKFEVREVSKIDSDELQVSTILTNDQELAEKIGKDDIEKAVDKEGVGKLLDDASVPLAKLVDHLDLGKFVKKIGDYEVYEKGEVFYRAMNQEDFDYLISAGKIKVPVNPDGTITSEMFTSPTLSYIQNSSYLEGTIIVKFQMKLGTIEKLRAIGTIKITDINNPLIKDFGTLPVNKTGWMKSNVLFKVEGGINGQVNIGLGRNGKGMEIFNNEGQILFFEKIN